MLNLSASIGNFICPGRHARKSESKPSKGEKCKLRNTPLAAKLVGPFFTESTNKVQFWHCACISFIDCVIAEVIAPRRNDVRAVMSWVYAKVGQLRSNQLEFPRFTPIGKTHGIYRSNS